MATKRTPINRPARARLPAEALEIFKRMRELEAKRCKCKPRPDTIDYWKEWAPCEVCEAWHKLNVLLCRPLNLRPWDFPAVARPHWKRAWGIDREIFAGQQRRYRELEAALEAQK
jgi:hypothetical protein